MAYNGGDDPDALPAHLEPDQAAELLYRQEQQQKPQQQQQQQQHQRQDQPQYRQPSGQQQPRHSSLPTHPYKGNSSSPSPYQNRPQPPISQQAQQRLPPSQAYNHNAQPYNNNNTQTYNNNAQPYNNNNAQSYNNNNNQPYNNTQPPPTPSYNVNPHQSMTSPPPQNYGVGAAPPQIPHGRSPPLSRPPPTPSPGRKNASDASLFPLFKAVDKNGTGQLSEKELRAALVNGDWTSFDPHTVKMMIRLFDVNKSGTIGFDEFCGLWAFLAAWRTLFDRFDEDKSGYISFDEYTNALVAFGYRLSSTFVDLLYRTYAKSGENRMSFDLFVQSCIILKRMTDVFKKYDDDRDGYITLSFEEFLTEILRQR